MAAGRVAAEGQRLSHAEIEVAHGQHGRCQIGTPGIGAHPLEDRREKFGVQIALEADEAIGERRILPLRRLSVRIEQGVRRHDGIAVAIHRLAILAHRWDGIVVIARDDLGAYQAGRVVLV